MPKIEFIERKYEMALSQSRKELFLRCSRFTRDMLMRDKVPCCYELPSNLHGALNKHVCYGLFQMVSSFPVSESLLQAPSASLLGRARKGEPAEISEKQGFPSGG